MEDLLGLVGFFVIAGIFWAVKKVAERSVRRGVSTVPPAEDEYQYQEDIVIPQEIEISHVQAAKAKPVKQPEPPPLKTTRPSGSGIAAFIRKNPDKAILIQEILGPPKGLK